MLACHLMDSQIHSIGKAIISFLQIYTTLADWLQSNEHAVETLVIIWLQFSVTFTLLLTNIVRIIVFVPRRLILLEQTP